MGYFPNGTAGMDYEERVCRKCVHFGTDNGPACPIWSAHLLYCYELAGSENANHPGKVMLYMFIPRAKGGGNERCTMFRPKVQTYDAFARIERERDELSLELAFARTALEAYQKGETKT